MSFSSTVPTVEPDLLVNKTNWRWDRDITDFGADLYTLKYYLVQQTSSSPHKITLLASANGTLFEIDFDAGDSLNNLTTLQLGNYSWQAFLTEIADTDNVQFAAKGLFEIVERYDTGSADPRSFAEQMRDSIKAFITGTANIQDKTKTINDRAIEKIPIDELQDWLERYEAIIEGENQVDEKEAGEDIQIQKMKSNYQGFSGC